MSLEPSATVKPCLRLLLLVMLLGACGTNGSSVPVGSIEKFSVTVEVEVVESDEGTLLRAVYTPSESDLHLYDTELPLTGIDGIGRPTRLELIAGGQMLSAPTADVEIELLNLAPEGLEVPVYPDGAVTLTAPVKLTADPDELVISVTYMACSSDGGCKPPVVDHVLANEAVLSKDADR